VISESEFLSNSSTWVGGAIYLPTPLDLTATKTRFAENSSNSGGAVYLDASGRGVFEENVFENNTAAYGGGAIASNNAPGVGLQIKRNLFLNNVAGDGGGAISISRLSSTFVILENNTFYGNQAGSWGGAVASGTGMDLLNNTFSHNQATNGGASLSITANVIGRLYNNIFADSTGGSECYAFSSYASLLGNNNIVEDGSNPCAAIPGTIIADPRLGPLADNGGSTQTMELLPTSPAIDAGDNASCPATDQRGIARPQGVQCDVGAFEYALP
jgi:predicted outer membrane repeat protein